MTTTIIKALPTHLPAIKGLYRDNKKTLGFFPDGAFDDHIEQGHILASLDESVTCTGYLAYRVSRNKATIVHLCVCQNHRGQGVAGQLVQQLAKETEHLEGISLRCRPEYAVNNMWPQWGFVARTKVPGRSANRSLLCGWWREHHKLALFTHMEPLDDGRLKTVLDANVVFAIAEGRPEDSCLLEGWVQDDVRLMVTSEIFNEIQRGQDTTRAKQSKQFVLQFDELDLPPKEWQPFEATVRSILPPVESASDDSDRRHLAYAAAGGADLFITRDSVLLTHADPIEKRFNLRIIRPLDVPLLLDQLVREVKYQPARLAGSNLEVRNVQAGEFTGLVECFLNHRGGEKKAELERRLKQVLTQPTKMISSVVVKGNKEYLSLCVADRTRPDRLDVPVLRAIADPIAPTLIRHVIAQMIETAASEDRTLVTLSDSHAGRAVVDACIEQGFLETAQGMARVGMRRAAPASQVLQEAADIRQTIGYSKKASTITRPLSSQTSNNHSTAALLAAEQSLWPAKFTDLQLPAFIVPIKPRWALHLFDETAANQTLFGALATTALSCENVYYRSARPHVVKAPGRILWYVSQDKKHSLTKCIRACSYVDEVIVGKPKDVFRRFKRLGIYHWSDISSLVDGDISRDVMAFRFSGTELLDSPIGWDDIQSLLLKINGKPNQMQSPVKIGSDCFEQMYRLGFPTLSE